MPNNEAANGNYWLDQVDPELKRYFIVRNYPVINFTSRLKINFFHTLMQIPGPTAKGVSSTRIKGIGMKYFPSDIATSKSNNTNTRAAVLYIHGGGRIMGSSSGAMESALCSKIVQLLKVPVFSVHYRLAPNHPFPAGLDDVVNAYKWLVQHMMDDDDDDDDDATATATDEKTRILVVGESSGGGLTAELCQRLLDDNENQTEESKKIPLPVAHLMINPMLDDRTSAHTADDDSSLPPHLVWNHTSNLYAWGAYLGTEHKPGQVEIPNYAAAARRKDMAGLPPAWITVGDLDLFRQESREYIERLQSAGVDTNYEEVEGGFHGMLTMCTGEDETIAKVWSSFQAFGLRYLCV